MVYNFIVFIILKGVKMGKRIIKFIIAFVVALILGAIAGLILAVVRIAAPEYYDLTKFIMNTIFWIIMAIAFIVIFIIIGVSTIKEFNFMKLVNNELMYNGLTETIYNEASKRKERYKKNKTSVGYVGSVNMMINFLAMQDKFKEAEEMLEEFDLIELKDKMRIESGNPNRSNATTYFGLLDTAMCLYIELNNKEKVEYIYSIFNPLYNLYIAKFDYLTDVLYEAKVKYLIFNEEFNEANSILDILKSNQPFLYYAFLLDVHRKKKETNKDLIEETYNNAITEAEKLASKGFFKQSLAKKKEDIYKELAKEG